MVMVMQMPNHFEYESTGFSSQCIKNLNMMNNTHPMFNADSPLSGEQWRIDTYLRFDVISEMYLTFDVTDDVTVTWVACCDVPLWTMGIMVFQCQVDPLSIIPWLNDDKSYAMLLNCLHNSCKLARLDGN